MQDMNIIYLPELPLAVLLHWRVLPLRAESGELYIASSSVPDASLIAWLDGHINEPWFWRELSEDYISEYLASEEDKYRALGKNNSNGEVLNSDGEKISFISLSKEENRIVKLVNSTLHDAVADGASDIHIESIKNGITIKFRIDGMLIEAGGINEINGRLIAEQVVSRIKVLADLDISETRIPQDGRFKILLGHQGELPIDFRVSIMPSLHGEDVVLRILDKKKLATEEGHLSLSKLGFPDNQAKILYELARRPHGMLLVTGPTGSGKTTTLYALLMETSDSAEKTITIEDPIEYQLVNVLQVPVNERKGLTFSRGLRSVLRHDPDRIMVGEIRDFETAEIAVQAALTGHLVLSSIHANGVFEVIQRFTHMGIDLHALSTCLIGIVAQRLVRINCPDCRKEAVFYKEKISCLGLSATDKKYLRYGQGCSTCRGTGMLGRRVISQQLVLDDELRSAISDRMPPLQLKQLAASRGIIEWKNMLQQMLLSGELSQEEALRALAI